MSWDVVVFMGERFSPLEELEVGIRDREAEVVSVSVSLPEEASSQLSATGVGLDFEAVVCGALVDMLSLESVLTTSVNSLAMARVTFQMGFNACQLPMVLRGPF
jgi:hypothetical protein